MSARETCTPANHCPHCGYRVDAASPAGGDEAATPREGDVAICICCRGVSVFRADVTLGLPVDAEFRKIRAALAGLRK